MISFSEFLKEEDIKPGQAEDAHQPTGEASSAVSNPVVVSEINTLLLRELADGEVYNVQAGIQKIRKVLHRFGMDMPALYDADPEGDEITFDLNQFDNPDNIIYLYVLYFLKDEGCYEFFAQVGDADTIDNLASEIDDIEE
jgi:hypothetical protein